jgi:ribose 5-phosphate isomerase B
MRIAVGADHAGFRLKASLVDHLVALGHQVEDFGTGSEDSVDYPEHAVPVGRAVASGRADLGVLVCATGIGVSIAANKVRGVRAALVHDVTTAHLAREHNEANVLCFGGRVIGEQVAREALEVFLAAEPLGGRHHRRVEEITAIEEITALEDTEAKGTP